MFYCKSSASLKSLSLNFTSFLVLILMECSSLSSLYLEFPLHPNGSWTKCSNFKTFKKIYCYLNISTEHMYAVLISLFDLNYCIFDVPFFSSLSIYNLRFCSIFFNIGCSSQLVFGEQLGCQQVCMVLFFSLIFFFKESTVIWITFPCFTWKYDPMFFIILFFQVSIAGQPAGVESARVRIRVML